MKSTTWLIAGGVLALGYGGWRLYETVAPYESDQVKIQKALRHSIDTSRRGQPGGVLDLISDKLTVNQATVGSDRRSIASFIRDSKPDVEVQNQTAQNFGDEARITSPVTLSLMPFGSRQLDEVTLIFRQEKDYVYGIFPTTRWKLSDIRVPENAVSDLIGM
jgi:hypothetical protein